MRHVAKACSGPGWPSLVALSPSSLVPSGPLLPRPTHTASVSSPVMEMLFPSHLCGALGASLEDHISETCIQVCLKTVASTELHVSIHSVCGLGLPF